YWGTPLPIRRTTDGSQDICIGSIAEIIQQAEHAASKGVMATDTVEKLKARSATDSFDLHRPYVDEIVLASVSGEPMYREADLIDVWFDSGAMPYAQWHYPFENKDVFEKNYPADFISEGVDQTQI